jgi:hypothetical protein
MICNTAASCAAKPSPVLAHPQLQPLDTAHDMPVAALRCCCCAVNSALIAAAAAVAAAAQAAGIGSMQRRAAVDTQTALQHSSLLEADTPWLQVIALAAVLFRMCLQCRQ